MNHRLIFDFPHYYYWSKIWHCILLEKVKIYFTNIYITQNISETITFLSYTFSQIFIVLRYDGINDVIMVLNIKFLSK